jgi:hypothetical protein
VSRVGDIKFKNGRLMRKFASGALREREATTCTGKYYLCPFFLGKFCNTKLWMIYIADVKLFIKIP